MLRVRNGKLEHLVKEGYGQSMYTDVKVLKYNSDKDCFEGRVWDGNFGPGDNTTWIEIPFGKIVEKFGEEAAEPLKSTQSSPKLDSKKGD